MECFALHDIVPVAYSGLACGTELKVDPAPPGRRTDILPPHRENRAWHGGKTGSQIISGAAGTFRAPDGSVLAPGLFEGLLDYSARVVASTQRQLSIGPA